MSDEVYEFRNALALGNFQQVITDGTNMKPNAVQYKKKEEQDAILAERDALVNKAHLGLGEFKLVLDTSKSKTDPHNKAVLILARMLQSERQHPDEVVNPQAAGLLKELSELWGEASSKLQGDALVSLGLTAAEIYIRAQDLETAFRLLKSLQDKTRTQQLILEIRALTIDILLRIDRTDLAEKEYKEMAQVDDEFTHTQLCAVQIALATQSEDKIKEAEQTLSDLRDKAGATVQLLNLNALVKMAQGQYNEAEKLLNEAMQKGNVNDAETLINMVVCAQHQQKPAEYSQRYIERLRSSAAHHAWVRAYNKAEQAASA